MAFQPLGETRAAWLGRGDQYCFVDATSRRLFVAEATDLARPVERVAAFYNQRGTAEQRIKEGKAAIKWTRLSAVPSPPTPSAFNFMRSPTISAILCARWRCPRQLLNGL